MNQGCGRQNVYLEHRLHLKREAGITWQRLRSSLLGNWHSAAVMTLLHISVHAAEKCCSMDMFCGGKIVCIQIVLYSNVQIFH